MSNWIVRWERLYENSEAGSDLIIDGEGNVIFTYNLYEDEILRERKRGTLVSVNPEGEENWEFTFPEYNYLYFKGNIGRYDDMLYTIADSNQCYDSGYERGLYAFGVDGSYLWHYAAAFTGEPALDNKGNVYVFDIQGLLYAFRPDGKLLDSGKSMALKAGSCLVIPEREAEAEAEREMQGIWGKRGSRQLRSGIIQEGKAYCLGAAEDIVKDGYVSLTCMKAEECKG